MNILMITNVFAPQIGGVTRSVQQFCEEYRKQGHRVLVIAPEYAELPDGETDVIRVQAIPNFYLKQYSLPIPIFSALIPQVRDFAPDIVHVHHPFLLGSIGQLIAGDQNIPLVYTHHTRYSVYIEAKTDLPRSIEVGIVELILGFCELCDGVVAPSQGIRDLLLQRGVTSRIEVIPTGVDLDRFTDANPDALRHRLSLSEKTTIVGHVGRLAPEKNTPFLARAVASFLKNHPDSVFVVVGDGPDKEEMETILQQEDVGHLCHFIGFLEGSELVNAYASFDIFAFASHSETQGMVLAEAMAAGVPVVGVDATGVRDLIIDGVNGRLIPRDDVDAFVEGLKSIATGSDEQRAEWSSQARHSAKESSQSVCGEKMLQFYQELIESRNPEPSTDWQRMQQLWDADWQMWKNRARAIAAAANESFGVTDHSNFEADL